MIYIATIRRIELCGAGSSAGVDSAAGQDSQAWWQRRQAGEGVVLMKEDSNAVAPDVAVAAYVDNEKCGYVASEDVEVVRALIGKNDGVGVRLEEWSQEEQYLLVSMEVDDNWEPAPYQPRLSKTPIAGISLPQLDMARELKVDQASGVASYVESLMDLVRSDKARDDLFDGAEWLSQHYGQSLSGDDYRAAVSMVQTIEMLKQEEEGMTMLDEEVEQIRANYVEMSNDCLRVWKKEMKAAERVLKAKNGLVDEIDMLLTRGKVSREGLLAELTAWLEKMPHNLFGLWDSKPSLFAQRLFYERFTTAELDAIKIYLCIYTYVREWGRVSKEEDWGAVLFPHHVDNWQRANIKREMDRLIAQHPSVPELVKKIRALVARGELNSPLDGNFTKYCRALKGYFGCEFDNSNFRKAWNG